MPIRPLLLSLCLLAAAPAMAEDMLPNMSEHTIDVGGVKRWYRLYQPESYRAGNPAVLLLHGGTQNMRQVLGKKGGGSNRWMDIADREGLLLIIPNAMNMKGEGDGNSQNWHDLRLPKEPISTADDVGFLTQLVDFMAQEYRIDAKRVYVTGASNGGMMTYRLLIDAPEHFAAGAAFIASLPSNNPALRAPKRPTPLFIYNGKKDSFVKWQGGEVKGKRGQVMATEDAVAWWVKANKADAVNVTREIIARKENGGNCTITKTTYPALQGGAETVFYVAEEGGHTIPSIKYPFKSKFLAKMIFGTGCNNLEAADLAWEFMKRHTGSQR